MKGDHLGQYVAVWSSIPSDRNKRGALKAAVEAMWIHPKQVDEQKCHLVAKAKIRALLNLIDGLEDARNDIVHAPLYFGRNALRADYLAVAPYTFLSNSRAMKLEGKHLLSEFRWCRDYATVLGRYSSPPPMSLLEWTEQRVPGLIENFGIELLARQLVRPEMVQPFMDLEWSAHSFPETNVELLIGDRPLWYYERPDHAHFSIALPLSPRVLFVGSRQPQFSRDMVDAGQNAIARKVNISMVSRAVERVYGRAELKFVDRTFKETPGRTGSGQPENLV
jgi:hypothetical protein